MSKHIDLNHAASTICDLLAQGIIITIDNDGQAQKVNVLDPANGHSAIVRVSTTDKPTATTPASVRKHNARWWSRFNFEKNIMKMTLLALQDRYPAEASFPQSVFAARLASMMSWEVSTARKHITRAAKMGILNRTVIGTVYHIAGINDVDAETARDEVADRTQPPVYKPLPGEHVNEEHDKSRPAYYRELFDEGMPDLEHPIEKPVDETILP